MPIIGSLTTKLGELSQDIQWMPPGVHDVSVSNAAGKVIDLKVKVDQSTAEAVESARVLYASASQDGSGDAPYLDFNHDDGPASAWVKRIYWGGEDPKEGGVRCEVEWTGAGQEAITGKTFRRFSPGFRVDATPNKDGVHAVIGAPVNMGGLVNQAAFRSIADIFAGQVPVQPKPIKSMDETTEALQAQIDALTKRNTELEQLVADMQAKQAEEVVAKAVAEGRLSADPEVKAKWLTSAKKDPSSLELLASLPKNPVLNTIYATAAANKVVDSNTSEDVFAKYKAIEDPNARLEFFSKNREAILKSKNQ